MSELRQPPRDIAVTLALLATLLWWEASGLDLAVAGWYGSAAGFALRDHWWTRDLLHSGGRYAVNVHVDRGDRMSDTPSTPTARSSPQAPRGS